MLKKTLVSTTAAAILACAASSASANYVSVVVLGDSLSDNGNAFNLNTGSPGLGVSLGYLVPSNPLLPPYPAGATKNTSPGGMVAVEVMAAKLGLPLLPSTAGGTNFAVSGATTGTANFAHDGFQVLGNPPIPFYPGLKDTGVSTQLGSVLAGGPANPDSLYVVWAGPNDVFLAGVQGVVPDVAAMVGNTMGAIGALYGAGARTFLVPNMPDLGQTPLFLGTPDAPGASLVTQLFNDGLALAIGGMESNPAFAGIDIRLFDTFDLFNDVIANPAAFGFDDVEHSCMAVECTNPDKFLFWDEVHPTATGHAILGPLFAAAVAPEPSVLLLLMGGLIGFAASRRAPRFA